MSHGRSEWADLTWFVVLYGIADAYLWGFDADGWRLRHGDPAGGSLGVLPQPGGVPATLDDALWLADVIAFDHDAPVGVRPAHSGPGSPPSDPAAVPPRQPLDPLERSSSGFYWEALGGAYTAAADLRFNASFVLRYDNDDGPSTDFASRFDGREQRLGLYAMAARQADLLSEYLCLYRVLEATDGSNGTAFASAELSRLGTHDFGCLELAREQFLVETEFIDAFEGYQRRASEELDRLADAGVSTVPAYLYDLRNRLAHGRRDVVAQTYGPSFEAVAHALPIVKLLARLAVEL